MGYIPCHDRNHSTCWNKLQKEKNRPYYQRDDRFNAGRGYYWRTSTRREIDFVIEHGRKILPVEAKITRNPTISDAKNLLAFMEEHPRASQGVIVHGGNELLRLHSRILAVPWWWLDR